MNWLTLLLFGRVWPSAKHWLNPLDGIGSTMFRQIHLWAEHLFCPAHLMGHGMSWSHGIQELFDATNVKRIMVNPPDFRVFLPKNWGCGGTCTKVTTWEEGHQYFTLFAFGSYDPYDMWDFQVQVERWCRSSTIVTLKKYLQLANELLWILWMESSPVFGKTVASGCCSSLVHPQEPQAPWSSEVQRRPLCQTCWKSSCNQQMLCYWCMLWRLGDDKMMGDSRMAGSTMGLDGIWWGLKIWCRLPK